MSQDNKKSIVMYQGDGSNNVFSVPMAKGKYGTVSVAFVRRGLADYDYNPNTFTLNGGLFAWSVSSNVFYTDTPIPAVGATVYNQYGTATDYSVTVVAGSTITISDGTNTLTLARQSSSDIDENTLLTWTGTTLQVGDYIVIERKTTRKQPFEFQNNQKHIEKSDDNLERQIQEVADKVDNALLVDPTHTIDSNKMNPLDWMKTIIRCVDFSARALRYANGWLDYSLDDPNIADGSKTWHHLLNTTNVKDIHEVITIDPETQEEIRNLYYTDQDGATHKILLSVKMEELADVSINNLTAGQFLMFDGLHWKNVFSSATASWGTILGNITDQTDLTDYISDGLSTKVSKSGDTMTGLLKMRATESFKCAIAPSWDGVGFYKLNSDDSVTLIASIETPDGFVPWATNTYNIGSSLKKWKNLYLAGKAYMSVINNGYDIAVPVTNSADTLALKSQVDDAANSGEQLYSTGVWYAKMHTETVAPSAKNGRNYADFSQVDSDNNPIIVIYERQNGAWVELTRITPPANHNGYITVTSKIWDISEQAGQQGGQILWSYNSKTFTPYPKIISFESIKITGKSTVEIPANPVQQQIVNKKYVDDAIAGAHYHPELLSHEWDDHERSDMNWVNALTFSWQDRIGHQVAYDHLADDYNNAVPQVWTVVTADGTWFRYSANDDPGKDRPYCFKNISLNATPQYTWSDEEQPTAGVCDTRNGTVYSSDWHTAISSGNQGEPQTETIAGITITYYIAEDGHKICLPDQESNVAAIYAATGVAWYYIIDTTNQRFKLPRIDPVRKMIADSAVVKTSATEGYNPTGQAEMKVARTNGATLGHNWSMIAGQNGFTKLSNSFAGDLQSNSGWAPTNLIADLKNATGSYFAGAKYLYFYVGGYTQSAVENTAGLNASLFNNKADLDLANVLANIDFVVESQLPTSENNYTWYRKYKSGWVEQGGKVDGASSASTINFPVSMADSNYYINGHTYGNTDQNVNWIKFGTRTTTGITYVTGYGSNTRYALTSVWEVKGKAAS